MPDHRSLDRAVAAPGRRAFLKLIGVTSVLGTIAPVIAWAQSAGGGAAKTKPSVRTKPAAAAAPEEKISDDARALASIIKRRYGKHLNAAQLESVTRDLDGDLQSAQRLRAVKLRNADEPDAIFKA